MRIFSDEAGVGEREREEEWGWGKPEKRGLKVLKGTKKKGNVSVLLGANTEWWVWRRSMEPNVLRRGGDINTHTLTVHWEPVSCFVRKKRMRYSMRTNPCIDKTVLQRHSLSGLSAWALHTFWKCSILLLTTLYFCLQHCRKYLHRHTGEEEWNILFHDVILYQIRDPSK